MLVEPIVGTFKRHPFSAAAGAILIAGAAALWSANAYRSPPMLAANALAAQPACAPLDQDASRRVAALIFDTGATADWRLDQALLQLRRARKHCSSGAVQVAYYDYVSLQRGFALPAGSISTAARSEAGAFRPTSALLGEDKLHPGD